MQLILTRTYTIKNAIIGTLEVDGKFECFTLEKFELELNIDVFPGPGRYLVAVSESYRLSEKYAALGLGSTIPKIIVPGFRHQPFGFGASPDSTQIAVGTFSQTEKGYLKDSILAYIRLRKKLDNNKTTNYVAIKDIRVEFKKRSCIPAPFFDGLYPLPARDIVLEE